MANITRASLDANALTNFPDNNTNFITPALLRAWLDDAVDSFVTQKDKSTLENAIYENEGSALTAAASINLANASGNYLHITGAFNGVNSFGTCPAGSRFILVFDGVCTITDSATLVLPGGSNITTAAGDCAMLVSEGSGSWRMVGFFPISGGAGGGTVTSVDLTMPSAFAVSGNPITTSGTLAVTGAGLASQYVRGDGTLANFPAVTGGGSSVSYYLNGSVTQLTIGGATYYQMSKTPIFGAGTNFTRTNASGNGYIASFITDANDPNILSIPGGNFNLEFYFNATSTGGSPAFYAELYKYDGASLTLIASGSTNPEGITNGTTVDAYFTPLGVPTTALALTDRLAVRIFVIPSGRNITLHTEDNNLCQVITTISTGLTALNGLTSQVQTFATGTSGTDFAISSVTNTHTLNLPDASATARGLITASNQALGGIKTFGNGTSAGEIRLLEPSGSGTESVGIKAQAMGSNYDLTLPVNAGTSGQVLQTNGSGLLSWTRNGGTINSSYLLDTTETQATGTAETINKTLLIPANTFSAQTAFKIIVRIRKDNPGFNVVATRIYIGTNPASIVGAFNLGLWNFVAALSYSATIMERSVLIINPTTQTQYNLPQNGTTAITDVINGINTISAIDWTVSQYIIVTTASSAVSYSAFIRSIQIIPQ